MEIILVILFFIFFGWIVRAVLGTLRAAGKAAIGKGSLKDNLELEFRGMGGLRTRITENQKPDEPFFLGVEVRGLFPVYLNTTVGFVISVLVKNDAGELEPVLSMIQEFQEPGSRAFQDKTGCGEVSPNQGYLNWVQIGVIPTEILQPPNGGKHQLNIVVRLVDMNNMPSIDLGYSEPSESLWTGLETYDYNFEVSGYREEAEHKDKAQSLTIKIGMAVAMADGSLDNSEGNVLKNWIVSALSHHTGEKRESMKKTYNDAMKEAYDLAKSDNLILSDVCSKLKKFADNTLKYEALELAHKVMAADGVVDEREMKVIHKVADALGIDSKELEKIRDKQIVKLQTKADDVDIDSLLGIDPSSGKTETCKTLKKEFIKWNSRLNSLPEGEEKDNAQQMLDLIGKARKKYAC
jgi:tellurite resistance protein